MTGTVQIDALGTRVDRHAFQIDAMGSCAARALRDGARGEVGAVFERSFYIVIDGQWICLVPSSGGLGPLNALCREGALHSAIKKIRVGATVAVAEKSVNIASIFSFTFDRAAVWVPAPPGPWNKNSVARGLAHFNRAIASRVLPQDGLAMLLTDASPVHLNAVANAAQQPLRSLRAMLLAAIARNDFSPDIAALILPLLGLGPGLTPSGDDAIGGALIALHLLGQDRARDAIWEKLSSHIAAATNDISRAHLEAAAEGFGHETIHRIANSLLTGDATHLREEINAVDAIGHTSGWDALIGVVMTLTIWLEVQNAR